MTAAPKHDGAEAWRNNLITTASGAPKPLLANAITGLRDSGAWLNVLAFDQFRSETIIDGATPWDGSLYPQPARVWTPQDDALATDWLQRNGISVPTAITAQAVDVVSRDRTFHPVIDYLDGLQHDGKARLSSWLSDYLGVERSAYVENVGRAMMIGAVARIREPGCKHDTVPIIEGPQGARKSTAIKTLFDPWFSDELADLGSKDAAMQTRGVWCLEVSELDAMSRMEVSRIKAFISRTTDRYRPPYGHRIVETPRACVFMGTTNADGYLKDETGGRRFWPIKVGTIDIDGLSEARDQLWAEAAVLHDAGAVWWLTKAETVRAAEEQQRARYAGDVWEETINRYICANDEVTVEQVLRFALQVEIHRCGQTETNRVARILKSLGMVRKQRGSGVSRRWVYSKPVDSTVTKFPDRQDTSVRLVPDADSGVAEPLAAQA